ncbi:hypothetical protein BDV93DRAFT_509697 [Ceratobasidium sp. AG-I]|nr:hypothetical protein BDV93DRAFT_509697 [Ceratobasidium sp. AG-I]
MNPGDSAGDGNQTRAEVSTTAPTSGTAADILPEAHRLRLELERLRGELNVARAERDIARTETAAARSMMKDYKESVEETKSRVRELRKDLDRYRDRRDDDREDWRLKSIDYEEQIAALKHYEHLRCTQPPRVDPVPYESPESREEFYSMYEDDRSAGQQSAPNTTPVRRQVPLPAVESSTASTNSSAVATTTAPTTTTAVAPATANSYSGVTQGTPAFRGYRPIEGVPPVNFGQPDKSSGTASLRWADADGASQAASLKRRSTGDLNSGRGRHAPRGGTGFSKAHGNTRVASARRAAKAATADDLQFDGRHTVNTTDPAGAEAWRVLDAPTAVGLFQGGNITSLDPALHARQRTLVRHAWMVPCDRLSATQQHVLQLAQRLEQLGNHPIVLSTQIPTGVRFGEAGTYSSSRADMGPIIDRVNRIIGEIFSRPDTYRRFVASIAPDVSNDIYSDPLDQTVLNAASRMNATMFPDLTSVTHRSVGLWLWNVVHVPRSIARHMLEPYFRRNQRHSIAAREFTRMDSVQGMPDDVIEWVQRAAAQPGHLRTSFVVRTRARYAIRDLDRMVWVNLERTHWRWLTPPPTVQSAVARTTAQTLQEDVSYLEVDLDVDWIPESVRTQFRPVYHSVFTEWEQDDLLAHEVPEGEPNFDQEDTMDSN